MMLLLSACVDEMKDTPPDDRVLAQASVELDGTEALNGTLDLLQKSTNLWELYIGDSTVTVDTPSGADLSGLDGEPVTGIVGDGNLILWGDTGTLLYVLATGRVVSSFAIAAPGERYGTFYEQGWQVDFGAIEFDGAPVGPGAVDTVTIDGALYRATTIAQLQVSRYSDAASKCGPSDTLSYELLLIAEAATAEDRTRSPDDEYARVSCG